MLQRDLSDAEIRVAAWAIDLIQRGRELVDRGHRVLRIIDLTELAGLAEGPCLDDEPRHSSSNASSETPSST